MKPYIRVVVAAMMLLTTPPQAHALFGRIAAEKDRRIETEQKLEQREQTNSRLHIAISILSAGVVIALIIGAAAGSKTRRDV